MSRPLTIVWFLYDFRLADHPALHAAVARGDVLPVYVHDPAAESPWEPGGARRWWMHHALTSLQESLAAVGQRLVIRRGNSQECLLQLARESGADAIIWNERWTPSLRNRDAQAAVALGDAGLKVKIQAGPLLHHPEKVTTGTGGSYTVFTPFWRKLRATVTPDFPLPAPALDAATERVSALETVSVTDLSLLPKIAWDGGFYEKWEPGESGAHKRLQLFLEHRIGRYHGARDLPAVAGTSELSPYLVHGEITPRQIWHAVVELQESSTDSHYREECEHLLRELAWRDFSYHVLHFRPETPHLPLKPKYAGFPWLHDPSGLRKWQKGQTGYPIVDAGMRQLWHTGWMHNRVRMVVASFLTKDLLLPWQDGARWFWETLVDADLANNSMGWQWAAGCGADAQPFFRIFNPVSQGEKFDPDGEYVKRWVPELEHWPAKLVHAPWTAQGSVKRHLQEQGHSNYPPPVVDHAMARDRALDALKRMGGEG